MLVTEQENLPAGRLFDARGPGRPEPAEPPAAAPDQRAGGPRRGLEPGGEEPQIVQRFVGCEVQSAERIFDPACAVLMDIVESDRFGLRFIYVLALSAHRALVEDTYIGRPEHCPGSLGVGIDRWLARAGARDGYDVLYREAGDLPMAGFARRLAPDGVHRIGAAGAALRPSSGYAFTRIQRQSTQIAEALVSQAAIPTQVSHRRTAALDSLFITALARDARPFPEIFRRMLGAREADRCARFMTDSSSWVDDLRVISALPSTPFTSAAAAQLRRRLLT